MRADLRYTLRDLDLLPDDGNRYELIDGDLYVSKQPDWEHQRACHQFGFALQAWDLQNIVGVTIPEPGIIFAEDEAVAPDIVWISRERFRRVIGDDGKLHDAPDLVVEVLSPGGRNEERDREIKLKLYSRRGVREYWIVNWSAPSVQVFRRENGALRLAATLWADDPLTSPLLPGFSARVGELCALPG